MLKVPFQDALDLVRTRKVYLKAGYAYIPHQDIVTIVLNDFRTRLSKALAVSLLWDNFTLSMTVTYMIMQHFSYSRVCPLPIFILITPFAFLLRALVFATTQWLIVTQSERQSWLVHCFHFQAYQQICVSLQIHSKKLNFTPFFPLYKCMFKLMHSLFAVCLLLYSTLAACCSCCCLWCPEGSGVNVMSRWEECVWHEMSWGSMYEHVPAGLLVIFSPHSYWFIYCKAVEILLSDYVL